MAFSKATGSTGVQRRAAPAPLCLAKVETGEIVGLENKEIKLPSRCDMFDDKTMGCGGMGASTRELCVC